MPAKGRKRKNKRHSRSRIARYPLARGLSEGPADLVPALTKQAKSWSRSRNGAIYRMDSCNEDPIGGWRSPNSDICFVRQSVSWCGDFALAFRIRTTGVHRSLRIGDSHRHVEGRSMQGHAKNDRSTSTAKSTRRTGAMQKHAIRVWLSLSAIS